MGILYAAGKMNSSMARGLDARLRQRVTSAASKPLVRTGGRNFRKLFSPAPGYDTVMSSSCSCGLNSRRSSTRHLTRAGEASLRAATKPNEVDRCNKASIPESERVTTKIRVNPWEP
jgi:hypothetical protein